MQPVVIKKPPKEQKPKPAPRVIIGPPGAVLAGDVDLGTF